MTKNNNPSVILKPGRDKSVRHRHPWIFSGAIDGIAGAEPEPGEVVQVQAADGSFLAHGYFNAKSRISVRLLDWQRGAHIDEGWWRERVAAAVMRRTSVATETDSNACRLVYAEADGLPGLIVDQHDGFLAVQMLTVGIERVRGVIHAALEELLHPTGVVDLSDDTARGLEGLPPSSGSGTGKPPDRPLAIRENGFRYLIDLFEGQKTGFYLDQRTNRRRVAPYAQGKSVLDGFCYTGGFTLPALAAGAQAITCIDSSAAALDLLRQNVESLQAERPACANVTVEVLKGNLFELMRRYRDEERHFEMVILDPPKLAAAQAQVPKALRAYKDLNLLAMKLLTPGGILATFSCSGAVSRSEFHNAVAWAATDAQRSVQVIEQLSQAEDHPVLISFPESEYLKGLICRVL